MADNVAITAGTGTDIATDQVTGTGEHVQITKLAISTDGSRTLVPADSTDGLSVKVTNTVLAVGDGVNEVTVDVDPADAEPNSGNALHVEGRTYIYNGTTWDRVRGDISNGMDVDVTRVKPDGTNTMPSLDAAARAGFVKITDGTNTAAVNTNGGLDIAGDVAHDTADSGNPIKVGAKAIAHSANPGAVAAGDRTDLYANRAGVLFTIGGHPNTVTLKHTDITTAVTDAAIITISAGTKIVVTRLSVTLDSASTVFPLVRIGFGATNTPTTTGVLASHGGVPAGGGFTIGDGSGILGIGGDGEDLRVTTTGNATGNGLHITVSYYTIES